MRHRRVTVVGLLQAAAVLTVLFSALTSLDIPLYFFELFTHFRLQYLAASVLLLFVFAYLRDAVYAVLLLVTVVLNASLIVPWYAERSSTDDDRLVKILHANVLASNGKYERLLEALVLEQPDIIVLQEFSPQWLDATRSLQSQYPFNYIEPREDNFGIALFSRLPLDTVYHVDSPPLSYPTVIATATIGGKNLTLISTHPTVPLGRTNYDARNEQLQSIVEIVQQAQDPVILVGDLNASLWDPRYREIETTTGLRNSRRGFGVLPTWPTFMPFAMIPIDHVLVSPDIGVVETRRGSRIGSDHLPLIVTVAL